MNPKLKKPLRKESGLPLSTASFSRSLLEGFLLPAKPPDDADAPIDKRPPMQIALAHYEANKTGASWRGHESND